MIRKIAQKLFPRMFPSSEYIIERLKQGGAKIGKGVYIFGASRCEIDDTRPWLLSIGDYTVITQGVVILTHDYSLSTLRRVYGEWIGEGKETVIGENCFLGMNSIILMGSHIGNNVIVGAGSVVHGDVPDNVLIAGNPAKVICTLQKHYENRVKSSPDEAKFCVHQFIERKGKKPEPKDMGGFKFLFAYREKKYLESEGLHFFCHGDEPKEIEDAFYASTPKWNGFEEMLTESENDYK